MRILHILSTPRAEGTPNLVLDWLSTGEHEQEVFVLNADPPDLTASLRVCAAWYGEADFFSHGWRKFFGIALGLRDVCRERRPDVVICWPTGFANWVCLGARWSGVQRLLVHCGNPPNRGFKADWITRYVMWPLRLLGAKCVCCSDYVRDQFRGVPLISADLFHTVYNCSRAVQVAVRAETARNVRPAGPHHQAIMVATLERHKDHLTLLAAAVLLRKRDPLFRLRLVGEGSLRPMVEARVAQLGLGDIVDFLGMRRDVPELLGTSDVFLFSTTRQEGLGSVLLEALAAGLPVVATDVPACRELLAAGEYGILVAPDNPEALAEATMKALQSSASPEKNRRYAETFTSQRMIGQYLHLVVPPSE